MTQQARHSVYGLAVVALITLLPATGTALDKCKAKIKKQDGAILVSAKDIAGPLRWGYLAAAQPNAIADPTCANDGSAKNCEIGVGAVGITPPEACTIYLADDGSTCAAYIKSCTPGLRRQDPAFFERFGNEPTVAEGPGTAGGDCVTGEVFLFAGSFAPRGTLPADGRLLPISLFNALFAILGTQFGGNGRTDFGVPDLRGLGPAGLTYLICSAGRFPSRD